MVYETFSEKETYDIGKMLGQKAKAGEIYCLVGDLGVGKTIFTKGFAVGMGIDEHITSPTFTIVNEYDVADKILYHFDVYRIGDEEEMYDIGFDEYLEGEGITFIEWANLIKGAIPEDATWIKITKNLEKGIDYRWIRVGEEVEEL